MTQARTQPESYDAWLSDFRWLEIHGAGKTLGVVARAPGRLTFNATTAKLEQERAMGWPGAVRHV